MWGGLLRWVSGMQIYQESILEGCFSMMAATIRLIDS